MTETWSWIGAELWLAAQPIAGTLVKIYPRSRGISLLPDPDVLDDLIAEAPEVPADVLAILRPAKADIPRILKCRVRRPINASEARWDAALFSLRQFLHGGFGANAIECGWREDELFACRKRGSASMNAASVRWSVKTR
jgi:hypothetical protein